MKQGSVKAGFACPAKQVSLIIPVGVLKMLIFKRFFPAAGVALAAGLTLLAPAAEARNVCNDFVLTCENGHAYPFCPRAISDLGDVVTGTLSLSPRHAQHMRLIPMGIGYRYAGKGIWFDGFRNDALLTFQNGRSLACTVTRQTLDPNAPAVLYTKG